MEAKKRIYEYLQSQKYIALATADKNGKPEVATVTYLLDGDDLLINTYVYYRKYPNLMANPQAAFVATTGYDLTLQSNGLMQQLEGEAALDAKRKLMAFDPEFEEFFNDDTRFFRLTPNWLRLRDYTKTPLEVIQYEAAD